MASGDLDADGRDDVLPGQGEAPTATSRVRGYSYNGAGLTLVPGSDFDTFPGRSYGSSVTAAVLGY